MDGGSKHDLLFHRFGGRGIGVLQQAEIALLLSPPPHARCGGPAVSYCLWKIDPAPAPAQRALAIQIHTLLRKRREKKNKLSSVVNFSSAVGVITNNQSRTVTVLKVIVTQSSFISSFIHLAL